MMESLANQFIDPDLKKYHQDALQRYRLPYWDPVKPRVKYDDSLPVKNMFAMPEILSTPKVWLVGPDYVTTPNWVFSATLWTTRTTRFTSLVMTH